MIKGQKERQKLSSVFVMFPEHCSVTQSAWWELVEVVCDVPQRPSCGLLWSSSADWLFYWSCGWRTHISWSSKRSLVGCPADCMRHRVGMRWLWTGGVMKHQRRWMKDVYIFFLSVSAFHLLNRLARIQPAFSTFVMVCLKIYHRECFQHS